MKTFMVAWAYEDQRHVIDVDSEILAATIAVALAEVGRTELAISGHDYEIDSETASRIKARIMERINLDGVRQVMEVLSG